MKKIISSMLIVVMFATMLVGCGKQTEENKETKTELRV